MSTVKILHLFNAFQVGGVERQHMMLVRELAPFYEQVCWSYNEGQIQDELDELGIEHRVGRFDVAADWLCREHFDCVVSRTNRYMVEMHRHFTANPVPLIYIRSFLRWFEGNETYFDAELERQSYSFPCHVFFSGPSLKEASNTLPMAIPGNELLFNGLDIDRFPMTPRTAPKKGVMRIGILANLAPHKNQHTAIKVLEPDLQAGRCTLVLGGDAHFPDYVDQVAQAAKGLPVELLGYIDDPVKFCAGVDVVLLSSTHEGWPIVLMEAMACGLPVIAPDVGDTAVLLEQGRFGLLYPAGNYEMIPGCVNALRSSKTYNQFARAAVTRARNFDIKTASKKLAVAIDCAVSDSRRKL